MSRLEKNAEWIKRRVGGKNGPGLKLGMGQGAPRAYQMGSRTLRRAKVQRDPSLPFLFLCIDKPLSVYTKTQS